MRGSVGQYTFSRLNGQTVVKEKVAAKETPTRTFKQMLRRVRWANVVALWQSMNDKDKPSFQSKPKTWSDFNAFMSANIDGAVIALRSDEARQGGCVVAGYQLTRGSLPSIGVTLDGSTFKSDINVGSLTMGASTTLAALSEAIISNNDDWMNADQLSLFLFKQTQDAQTGVPHVSCTAYEVTLDRNNQDTMLSDILPANTLAVADGKLNLGTAVTGGVAMVHSRKSQSKTLVSSQFIVVNNPLLDQYNTEDAILAAIESYGGQMKDDFLVPNTNDVYEDTVGPQP